MATINLTSTINSTGLTSDSISINILKSATVTTGGIARKSTTAVVGSKTIKNAGTITLRLSVLNNTASNAEDEISLAAGAWTLFPWDSVANITVYQVSAGTTLIEHGVFA